MLCRFRDSRNCSGGRLIGTPSSSRTSALPQLDVTRRLPCFTTTPPPAATTKATVVEILNESTPSPPVPQTSTIGPGISPINHRINCAFHQRLDKSGNLFSGLSFSVQRSQEVRFHLVADIRRKENRDSSIDVSPV